MSIEFSTELSALFRSAERHYSRVVVEVNGQVYDDTHFGGSKIRLDAGASSVSYDRLSPARSQARLTMWAADEEAKNAIHPLNRPKFTIYSGAEFSTPSSVLTVTPGGGTVTRDTQASEGRITQAGDDRIAQETVGDTVSVSPTGGVKTEIVWASLGVFQPDTIESTEYISGFEVQLGCVDKSEAFRNNAWKSPFQTGGGFFRQAIEDILTDRDPGVIDMTLWLYEYTDEDAPDLFYTEDDDPWDAVIELARSSESEIYFAKNGFLVIEQVPDLASQTPVYTLGGDEFRVEDGRRRRSMSIRDVYNGVICRGEAPWLLFPISGEYWDEDPASPTYRYGPFGERPYVVGSNIATTDAHCDVIAEAEYHKVAGVTEEVVFSSIKDPYLSVGNIIRVDSSVLSTSGTEPGLYTLDALVYPLGGSPMTGTTRRKAL